MKHLMIYAAFAMQVAHADPHAVSAAGRPVESADGGPWRIADWKERPAIAAEVLFPFGEATLTPHGRKVLDEVAQRLLEGRAGGIVATAHADRIGAKEYNVELSARRASVVRAYLVEQGVLPSVIVVDAVGAARPVASCEGLGEESPGNLKLVACLQPDRRVVLRGD